MCCDFLPEVAATFVQVVYDPHRPFVAAGVFAALVANEVDLHWPTAIGEAFANFAELVEVAAGLLGEDWWPPEDSRTCYHHSCCLGSQPLKT